MRRTGWSETFPGADRKLIVQLAQIPRDTEKDLPGCSLRSKGR
jgi:hypothetical protein